MDNLNDQVNIEEAGVESIRESHVCPSCGLVLDISVANCPQDGTILAKGLLPGTILAGKYEIINQLGSGGMGVIYKAKQIMLGSFVAVKMLHSNTMSPNRISRFHQEAKAANQLSHPNLIRVLDFGVTAQNQPYMVMDFVEGVSLAGLIAEQGRLPLSTALPILLQICGGMSYAHEHGILHRDLKPSNVIVSDYGTKSQVARIVDFGIAKIIEDKTGTGTHLTQSGEIFGSPAYMSPEQASGKTQDNRSDIYSLGCVIFETLTGCTPFRGNSSLEIMYKHINEKAPALNTVARSSNKRLPPELEEIVARTLEKEPDNRFQSMAELGRALERFRSGVYETRSNRGLVFTLSAVAALVFCLIGAVLYDLVKPIPVHLNTALAPEPSVADDKALALTDPKELIAESIKNKNSTIRLGRGATNADLEALKGVKGVISVSFSKNSKVAGSGLSNLIGSGVRYITMAECSVTDSGLATLARVPTLAGIDGARTVGLTAKTFVEFARTDHLLYLRLDGSDLDDESLETVTHISSLKALYLNNCTINDRGLSRLSKLSQLKWLGLNGIQVGLHPMRVIGQLKELRELSLESCGLSDDELHCLDNPLLESLRLNDNFNIDNKGLLELTRLKRLQRLEMAGCKVSEPALSEFHRALPDCDVILSQKDIRSLAENDQLRVLHELLKEVRTGPSKPAP